MKVDDSNGSPTVGTELPGGFPGAEGSGGGARYLGIL